MLGLAVFLAGLTAVFAIPAWAAWSVLPHPISIIAAIVMTGLWLWILIEFATN